MDTLATLDRRQLATVAGGIFYGEAKSATGERWAAAVDAEAKYVYDAVSPIVGPDVAGIALLPAIAIGEAAARTTGAIVDQLTAGGQP